MKPYYLMIIALCLSFSIQAQVAKTVDVTTPGSLHTLLTNDELTTITDLTLTGTIDARDFKTMRNEMFQLERIDIEKVTIAKYEGKEGTANYYPYLIYPENEIPINAFYIDTNIPGTLLSLQSILLPSMVNGIGSGAFCNCIFLKSITLPSSVKYIGTSAFFNCTGLTSIYCYGPVPSASSGECDGYGDPFFNVNSFCILYVPYGRKVQYANACRWNRFQNIEEMPGIVLSATSAILKHDEGSSVNVQVRGDVFWSATSNQPWLSLINDTYGGINLIAKGNLSNASRIATVTFSADDVESQVFTVTQEGMPQVLKITPGGLLSAFTHKELAGVMNLTLTGTMDARDFRSIRDSMQALTNLDLSQVTIVPYSGTEGPANKYFHLPADYPANEIPSCSFYMKSSLTSVSLPVSASSIGNEAFAYCSELTTVSIPSSVLTIGDEAFLGCSQLTSLDLPDLLMTIGDRTFSGCSALTSIDIPSSVTSIGTNAFSSCSGLISINVHSIIPVDLSHTVGVFSEVDKTICDLVVPYQAKARYAAAVQWMDFNITESTSGVALEVNTLKFDAGEQSYTVKIAACSGWSVSSNQPWLSFISPSWNGDQTLTITLKANPNVLGRKGLITVTSAADGSGQIIRVTQEGYPKTISITAGTLSSTLTEEELNGIYHLILEGAIDARDFKTMRDKMPLLNSLDISQATIVAYAGKEGTAGKTMNSIIAYPANEIPAYAFRSQNNNVINDRLSSIILPRTLKTIGENAFMDCRGLSSIILPPSVSKIKSQAFFRCISLETVTIPASVSVIGSYAFYWCTGLQSIYSHAAIPAVIADYTKAFSGCDMNKSKLYVPAGSKELYAKANEWKDFKNIVEMTTATEQMELNNTTFTCYPNPFTSEMAIEVTNPSLEEITIEIYSMSGLKIRTLARALKGQNISLSWDGSNDQGLQVMPGIYLCRMNGQTIRIIKGR